MEEMQKQDTINTSPEAGAPFFSAHREELKAADKHEQQRFKEALAKAERDGKEPFEYAKLCSSYWKKDNPLCKDASQSLIEIYRREYYLDYPDLLSIRSYALTLEIRDAAGEGVVYPGAAEDLQRIIEEAAKEAEQRRAQANTAT